MDIETMNDYERKRLENIRRNGEMMASLKLQAKANDISSAAKRRRLEAKGYKPTSEKKSKTQSPIIVRRSLRTRGISPDSVTAKGLDDDLVPSPPKPTSAPFSSVGLKRNQESFSIREAWSCNDVDGDEQQFVETILGISENAPLSSSPKKRREFGDCFDLNSLELRQENVARLVSGRIFCVEFMPSEERRVVVVGDKYGNVGFWDSDCDVDCGDGVYKFHAHSAPVSGISIQPHRLSKIFTSSYDGYVRMMDVNKEMFSTIYSSTDAIFSLRRRPSDLKSLYIGEGQGVLKVWDERSGKVSSSYFLHSQRINTIDFHPETNLMATGSSDGQATIWDLRNIRSHHPEGLKKIHHLRAVSSAYFSPSGSCLATTSFDNTVALLSGANFEDTNVISHNNQTSRWISAFRAIWGWDDRYLFIGNTKRALDIVSIINGTTRSLESPYVTAIPCQFAAYPYKVGVLAGATAGGQVYMWTRR